MENKIDGQGMSVAQVFEDRYVIDYFQREYKWEKKHIEQLLYDLDFAFHESYQDGILLMIFLIINHISWDPILLVAIIRCILLLTVSNALRHLRFC